MSDYISIGDVLSQLEQDGYPITINDDESPFHHDDDTPAYIKALLGLGGWIAAFFFLIFSTWCFWLTFAAIDDESVLAIMLCVLGLIAVGVTVMIQHSQRGVFVSQVVLAFQLVGQGLLIAGITWLIGLSLDWESDFPVWLLGLIVIAMEMILIPLYEDGIFRFLATGAAVIAANFVIYDWDIPGSLSVLNGLLAFGIMAIWGEILPINQYIRYRPLLLAVGYALVFGLFGTIAYELSNGFAYETSQGALYKPLITSLMLLALVLWLELRLFADYDITPTHRAAIVLLAITVIITLPTLTTPGILAAMMLILLGYRRRNSVLLVLAYGFMAGFIFYYYYNLEITLLVKSFILIATGVLFLGAGLILPRALSTAEAEEV